MLTLVCEKLLADLGQPWGELEQENSSIGSGTGDDLSESVHGQHPASGSSRVLLWAGVTSADQSPGIPAPYLVQEKELMKHFKHMTSQLEAGAVHETSIESAEGKLATYIQDEVAEVSKEMQQVNIRDTDAIQNILPTEGEPGPRGDPGTNGFNGLQGLAGATGSQVRLASHADRLY